MTKEVLALHEVEPVEPFHSLLLLQVSRPGPAKEQGWLEKNTHTDVNIRF